MIDYFDFEKPIQNINEKIDSLNNYKTVDQSLIDRYDIYIQITLASTPRGTVKDRNACNLT